MGEVTQGVKSRRVQLTKVKACSYYAFVHGNAAKHWLFRGEDRRGSGVQGGARQWKIGDLGKQNGSLAKQDNCNGMSVSRLS